MQFDGIPEAGQTRFVCVICDCLMVYQVFGRRDCVHICSVVTCALTDCDKVSFQSYCKTVMPLVSFDSVA